MLASYLAVGLSTILAADPAPGSDPCEATAGHHSYTILLQASGRFLHCRHGETTETPPVSQEKLVLQLPAIDPRQPYRFRLVDPAKAHQAHHPRLFTRQLETTQAFEETLQQLATSPETAGEEAAQPTPERVGAPTAAPPALPATPAAPKAKGKKIVEIVLPSPMGNETSGAFRELEARKARYLAVATVEFGEAVRTLVQNLDLVDRAATEIDSACAVKEEAIPEGPLRDDVAKRCEGGGPGVRLATALKPFEAQLQAFVKLRRAARDALIDLANRPTTAAEQDAAAATASAALEKAQVAATALVDAAPALAKTVDLFVRDLGFLRIALSIPPEAVSGHRFKLGRFPAAGLFSKPVIYQLHVSREPSALFDVAGSEPAEGAEPEAEAANEVLVDRFQPAEHRYFDLELAVMYSAGLPDHPELSGRLGAQSLVPVQTAGFSGGVLVGLEPLEFAHAETPFAGILRFPVVIVPFTLNPLTNYFLGIGAGWNDVGSISFGAHIGLTSIPANGVAYGQVFTTSPILLDHVTQNGPFSTGYFVSLSLDVLGIVHLFFAERQPEVRDVFGGATMAEH